MSINTHRLSRSKTPEVSITKRAWDERFCLAKIPVLPLSNSPFKTRKAFHMSRNSASNISSISMTRIQSRPDTSATNSTPVRSRSHKRLPINDVFVTAKIKLEEMWDKKMIPDGLRLAFKECIYTLPQYKSLSIMAKETEDLKTHNSLVQIAIKTVEEREKLLIQIQDLITAFNLAQENETTKDLQLEAAETLQTYRVISLNVVESIAR